MNTVGEEIMIARLITFEAKLYVFFHYYGKYCILYFSLDAKRETDMRGLLTENTSHNVLG